MNPTTRREALQRLAAIMPAPTTELEYDTVFQLLIAVILSAQATDVSVNAATRKLYPVAGTPASILALGVDGLIPYIQTIGLYRSKAKNVIETCRLILEQHGGEVPRDRDALQALPGVGRKTANVVLNTAFGEPTIAVDTHVFRVGNRTGLGKGKTPLAVELALLKNIPAEFKVNAHHWLILHGRYTCQARKPRCYDCVIADLCDYRHKTPPPGESPAVKAAQRKPKPTPLV
ncbi:MAG: endonuclease III [Burkholderiales bacterium]